ncbi:aldehyde dehydrogenase family protein [Acidovorax sp. FJL06]|uniref:aldehyde dehydrogenase family protein n=1 Tax=Acidovorax sp. FJL06 TaxID=2153365 RepID=UPI000F57E7AD|nr:aldehyde dehydrogenase family protein [Acidovorax sp. FJL06]RQO80599.1 aldehyde dehydrogenase family protein [Acidovorax sp. FJL06]
MSTAINRYTRHYINGQWVESTGAESFESFNPATGQPLSHTRFGSEADADAAVQAAQTAQAALALTTRQERLDMLQRIAASYSKHQAALVDAVQQSLGAPRMLCERLQVPAGLMQVQAWSRVLADFPFEEQRGPHLLLQQPVGVSLCITSWNWPLNGPMGVLLPALAAGCATVWKPSEHASATAVLLAQVMHDAGLPPGAFNMVLGNGHVVGRRLVGDPAVAMVSFTGSVAAGNAIGQASVAQSKRVVLELGGKSPFIVLPDADLPAAVKACMTGLLRNSGQSCNAPARLLVPRERLAEAEAVAAAVANHLVIGDPAEPGTQMGPLGNEMHYQTVQRFIEHGLRDGAHLVAGGTGHPQGLEAGCYARPTVFSRVPDDAFIVQEEAFGPVLVIQDYGDVDEAVELANRSEFGLSAYVVGGAEQARQVARRLQAGMVHINGAEMDLGMPFGGVKHSGLGRKFGPEGLKAYLEPQSILVPAAA